MTTLQRDIRMEIRGVLAKYDIDNLQMEIDLAGVIRPFVDAGRKYIPARKGDFVDYYETLAKTNPELLTRLKMRERVEASMNRNPDWEDLKSGWNGFDSWLVEIEKETGQTIEEFMRWFRSDDFRSKGSIYLNSQRIKDWWQQAFQVKEDGRHAL